MDKRSFLRTGLLATTAAFTNPFRLFSHTPVEESDYDFDLSKMAEGSFKLPALPYQFSALEPHIDAMTMEIHHDRHHARYVSELNAAVENTNYKNMQIEQLVESVKATDIKVRNNGGGHLNHSMFWKLLAPNAGGAPKGRIADFINAKFGSFDKFKEQFAAAAAGRFGSGWAWLLMDAKGNLMITSTANQDNPLMKNVVKKEYGYPILGIDVWEHAYYLKYQNKRPDYVAAFWNLTNWDEVNKNYDMAAAKFGKK